MTDKSNGTTTQGQEPTGAAPSEGPGPVTAPLAVTSDGQILINIEECAGRDVEGRARFVGVVLEKEERSVAMKTLENGAHELASQLAGQLKKRRD